MRNIIITVETDFPEKVEPEIKRMCEKVNLEKKMSGSINYWKTGNVFELNYRYDFEGRWTNPKIVKVFKEKIHAVDKDARIKHDNSKISHEEFLDGKRS